jgi:hypothetical protein
MKHVVSVSLGSPERNKSVIVDLNGTQMHIERIGTGGDEHKARQLFMELDGQVDVLTVGGIDLYVHMDGRDYPIRAGLRLVQDVHRTPVVDGRRLKYALERRVFELAAPVLGAIPHFRRAFIPFGTDRIGLIEALESVADEAYIGDLMFVLGIPVPLRGLAQYKRVARLILPLAGYFPISMLFPPGAKVLEHKPKFEEQWRAADLIAGDMHYIYKYAPGDMRGKFVVTNTTTEENIQALRERGVRTLTTTTPRYEGRSFGVNVMEGALTAYAGLDRAPTQPELEVLVEELQLKPEVISLSS